MKTVLRFFIRTLFRLLLFLLFALAVGCVVPQSCSHTYHCDQTTTVYFINHGYHTGIAVPAADWQKNFAFADTGLIEFGWGNRDFYMSKGFPVLVGLRALFWPSPSVLHVVVYRGPDDPLLTSAEVIPIQLCPEQYTAMTAYIANSFARDTAEQHRFLGEGFYGPRSAFYDALGSYYCFNNCNTWTGGALRAAEQQTPLWDGIPQSIRWHLQSSADTLHTSSTPDSLSHR
jgi:uncharacterized protein (TIGR02117 family)